MSFDIYIFGYIFGSLSDFAMKLLNKWLSRTGLVIWFLCVCPFRRISAFWWVQPHHGCLQDRKLCGLHALRITHYGRISRCSGSVHTRTGECNSFVCIFVFFLSFQDGRDITKWLFCSVAAQVPVWLVESLLLPFQTYFLWFHAKDCVQLQRNVTRYAEPFSNTMATHTSFVSMCLWNVMR